MVENQGSVESHNAREEVSELMVDNVHSGFCKALYPVYKVMKEETVSPRGQLLNLEKGIYSPDLLFKSTLCMGAEQSSLSKTPYSKIIRKARNVLVEEGKIPQTEELKTIIDEIKGYLAEETPNENN